MHKWLPILVALLVADQFVPDAALRDCIALALQQQELPLVVLPPASPPRNPIDALHLAITVPDIGEAPRHLDPCLAGPK